MSCRPLQSLPPTETLDLPNGLSLYPRVKILLTFFRSGPSVQPIDEWQLKSSLLQFLSPSLSVPDDDIQVRRSQDLKKRKREDPVASGTLYVRDLGFLKKKKNIIVAKENDEKEEEDVGALKKRFVEWRKSFLSRIDGIELNIKGVRFSLSASIPSSDDFDLLKKSWDEFYAFDGRGAYYSRGGKQRPDTLVLGGVPSRWFAEPRVSSKPSMLVTHTIFSVFGKIRKLNVAGDDDLGKTTEEAKEQGIVSGLHCKIWVQFEKYEDFFNAMKVLCGRSMQKQGSRLRVDYDVTWDKDGYFRNLQRRASTNQVQERGNQMPPLAWGSKHEAPRVQPQVTRLSSDGTCSKRFRD